MSPTKFVPKKGTTLIELTVVIAVVIGLILVLFFGANYYKTSANQANCISQLSQIQKSLRAYQHLEGLEAGDLFDASEVIGEGKPLPAPTFCPTSNGSYTFAQFVPPIGEAFVFCSEYDSDIGTVDTSLDHTPDKSKGF